MGLIVSGYLGILIIQEILNSDFADDNCRNAVSDQWYSGAEALWYSKASTQTPSSQSGNVIHFSPFFIYV